MAGKTHAGKTKSLHEQRKRSRKIEKLTRRLDQPTLSQAERIKLQNQITELQRLPVAF